MSDAGTFLIIGLVSLAFNTWKDIKTMKIDSTKNFVMTGLVLGFYFFTHHNLLISLDLTIIVFCLNSIMNKGKAGALFGAGDQEAFYWIVPGLFLVAWWAPIIFGWSVLFFAGLNFGIRWLKKVPSTAKTPGFMVLFGAFLLTASLYFVTSI